MLGNTDKNRFVAGVSYALGAYGIWGILPAYWKMLQGVGAGEVLAHRILWSVVFLGLLMGLSGRLGTFRDEVLAIAANRKKSAGVAAAGFLVSGNWLIYIWAVTNGRIVETSLGYYINPLFSVVLGVVLLKERLSAWQGVSFALAAAAVLYLTLQFGAFPWVSVSLAVTWGFYGLAKKQLNIGAITGIMLETLIVSPFALGYVLWLGAGDAGAFMATSVPLTLLLMGSGIVTAVPMSLFSASATRLSLTATGFLQYLAPSIMLVLGVFVFREPFSGGQLTAFSLIWAALVIFSLSRVPFMVRAEERMRNLWAKVSGPA